MIFSNYQISIDLYLYPTFSPGNHESQTMNQMYGFDGEVKSKYPFSHFVLTFSPKRGKLCYDLGALFYYFKIKNSKWGN